MHMSSSRRRSFVAKSILDVLHIVDRIDEYDVRQLRKFGGNKDLVMTCMVDPIDEYRATS